MQENTAALACAQQAHSGVADEGGPMTDMTKLIMQSSLGTELSEEQAAVLGGLMDLQHLKDGDYLISEGAADDTLHVLLEGKLEVVKNAAHCGAQGSL